MILLHFPLTPTNSPKLPYGMKIKPKLHKTQFSNFPSFKNKQIFLHPYSHSLTHISPTYPCSLSQTHNNPSSLFSLLPPNPSSPNIEPNWDPTCTFLPFPKPQSSKPKTTTLYYYHTLHHPTSKSALISTQKPTFQLLSTEKPQFVTPHKANPQEQQQKAGAKSVECTRSAYTDNEREKREREVKFLLEFWGLNLVGAFSISYL